MSHQQQGSSTSTTYFQEARDFTLNGPVIFNPQVDAPAAPAKRALKPIPGASHTRDRQRSPPNSICSPGTREEVIQEIIAWALSSLSKEAQHILWVFGFAGCGKSAIAQVVAAQLAGAQRLGASFFFFRGAGDRGRIMRFAETIASQIATLIGGAARHIQNAVEAQHDLLDETTSAVVKFNRLVYDPIRAVAGKWYRLNGVWRPFIVVIDGFDECEDKTEAAELVQDMVEFFERKPGIPLRFIITSRVEDHLHKKLHDSNQVRLLNLVERSSDRDISLALDAAISAEGGRAMETCAKTWPTLGDKQLLVKKIGRSFIFMTTVIKFLFSPFSADGLTPQERLPLALKMDPGFDGLYKAILGGCQQFPRFLDLIAFIVLARRPLSIVEIADLLDVEVIMVVSVLVELHAIIQVPGDDRTPITLWHSSLHDFLKSETRSGPLFASPCRHQHLTLRCIDLALFPPSMFGTAASEYAKTYIWDHCEATAVSYEKGKDAGGFPTLLARVGSPEALFAAMPSETALIILRSVFSKISSQSLEVVKILPLMQRPVSMVELADLLKCDVAEVVAAIKYVSGLADPVDVVKPRTLPAPVLAFLKDKHRSGDFFASPEAHELLAQRCITLAIPFGDHPASLYAQRHVWDHFNAALNASRNEEEKIDLLLRVFAGTDKKEEFLASAPDNILSDIYWNTISRCADRDNLFPVLRCICDSKWRSSISQIADSTELHPRAVIDALRNLHGFLNVPQDVHSPILPRDQSFHDFLTKLCIGDKPHPRNWQFQLVLDPRGTTYKQTDIIFLVLGKSTHFIAAIYRSFGSGESNYCLGAALLSRFLVIAGPKSAHPSLRGRRIVLVEGNLPPEADLGASNQLHEQRELEYSYSNHQVHGVVFVSEYSDNAIAFNVLVEWIAKFRGTQSGEIFHVRFDSTRRSRPEANFGWSYRRAYGRAAGVRTRPREEPLSSLSIDREAEGAWGILEAVWASLEADDARLDFSRR